MAEDPRSQELDPAKRIAALEAQVSRPTIAGVRKCILTTAVTIFLAYHGRDYFNRAQQLAVDTQTLERETLGFFGTLADTVARKVSGPNSQQPLPPQDDAALPRYQAAAASSEAIAPPAPAQDDAALPRQQAAADLSEPIPPPAPAQDDLQYATITTIQLKLRSCPEFAKRCQEVARVSHGTRVRVLSDVGNGWVKVRAPLEGGGSVEGYANAKYMQF
jgi:hypothetical protein